MSKILITGAHGFMGSACLRVLAQCEDEIHAVGTRPPDSLVDSRVQWHEIDMLDKDQVCDLINITRPEKLIHLAWGMTRKSGGGFDYESESHLSWIDVGRHLAETFEQAGGRRIVMAGTCIEYELDGRICRENSTRLKPDNIYGRSKYELQQQLHAFCDKTELSYAWGRVFDIYGPNENPNRLIPHVIRSILAGNRVKTTHGNQLRDYLYVDDVASALVALLNSSLDGPVNICLGEPARLKDLVIYIAKALNGENLLDIGAIPASAHEIDCLVGDNAKLVKGAGWKPCYSLEEGLDRTIESIRKEI
ncbi:MAG: NAD(P)-dependent oxidoreductase [Pontiella sp.]